jgi:hypothetical protein
VFPKAIVPLGGEVEAEVNQFVSAQIDWVIFDQLECVLVILTWRTECPNCHSQAIIKKTVAKTISTSSNDT